MDKNNPAPHSVEMSAEEFAAYQAFKAEQAKKEAEARIAALRDSYSEKSEAFINRAIKKLTPLSESIKKKKSEVLDEFSALQSLKAELLDIDGKEMCITSMATARLCRMEWMRLRLLSWPSFWSPRRSLL